MSTQIPPDDSPEIQRAAASVGKRAVRGTRPVNPSASRALAERQAVVTTGRRQAKATVMKVKVQTGTRRMVRRPRALSSTVYNPSGEPWANREL